MKTHGLFVSITSNRQVLLRFCQLLVIVGGVGVVTVGFLSIRASAQEAESSTQHINQAVVLPQETISTASDSGKTDLETEKTILVSIVGYVHKPGVYEVPEKARVIEVVDAAGGFTSDFPLAQYAESVNLAAVVSDGQQVVVGEPLSVLSSKQADGINTASGLVSINTATVAQLDELEGIGTARAAEIIANRPYGDLTELVKKEVLTQKLFTAIKSKIEL